MSVPVSPPPEPRRWSCEPHTWDDGSVSHEDQCAIYPWCPHEVGAYVCDSPCGCRCNPCESLADGHRAFKEERRQS